MFERNSVKLLYSLPKNSFLLISDTNNKIFLAKIKDKKFKNISKNSEEISKFLDQTNVNMKTNLFNSYDNFLNKKYKIKINQKTLERVKNYFN